MTKRPSIPGIRISKTFDEEEWYEGENGYRLGDKAHPDAIAYVKRNFHSSRTTRHVDTGDAEFSSATLIHELKWHDPTVTKLVQKHGWTARDAITLVVTACWRCLSVIANHVDKEEGFKFRSTKWEKSEARCILCDHFKSKDDRETVN